MNITIKISNFIFKNEMIELFLKRDCNYLFKLNFILKYKKLKNKKKEGEERLGASRPRLLGPHAWSIKLMHASAWKTRAVLKVSNLL